MSVLVTYPDKNHTSEITTENKQVLRYRHVHVYATALTWRMRDKKQNINFSTWLNFVISIHTIPIFSLSGGKYDLLRPYEWTLST